MKKLTFLIVAMLVAATATVQAQEAGDTQEAPQVVKEFAHFGYLSYKDALKAMTGYEEAQQKIQQLRDAYQQELRRNEEQLQKQFAEFVEGQQSFPSNILLKRQKELQQLMEQSMKFKEEARQLLQKNEDEVMQPLRERLDQNIQKVGMERGFAYVLNTDNHAYPFVNADLGTDITADVVE